MDVASIIRLVRRGAAAVVDAVRASGEPVRFEAVDD
jgi:hypothetical protein